jgi:bifunctional non-homologous end joining protein LigD
MKKTVEVTVDNRKLTLSNLDKVFYPATGFTKGQVIQYYTDISAALLPHLKDRALTLKRYPNGAGGMFFYEKNCPSFRPKWVHTIPVWSEGNQRDVNFCIVDDLPALVWAANLATLELHTSLARTKDVTRPTMVAFDLDPGPPANIIDCCRVGLWLRDIFEHLGIQSFPKTSGSKGLQVYVPLNANGVSHDETKQFAHALAMRLEAEFPERVVSNMKKSLRTGKVFVDWSQNDFHKTTVCVYSLRAKERPFVSTPVTWDEVKRAFHDGDESLLQFEADAVLARVKKKGDLFEPVLKLKQKLPKVEMAASR